MEDLKLKGPGNQPLIFLATGILSLLTLLLPFARYTHNKVVYQMSGLDFFLGKHVMGGSVYIVPVKSLWIFVLAGLAVLITAAINRKLNQRRYAKILLIASFIQFICGILFIYMLSSNMNQTRKPAAELGVIVMMLVSLLTVIHAASILYRIRYLSLLDFMILPGLAYLLVNNYLPLIGISIAFKKIDFSVGIWKSKWIGLENFRFLFQSADAYIITRNTLLYNATFIVLGNLMGIIVGILLSEVFSRRLQKVYQTLILLPQLISMVIVAYIVFGFLSNEAGFINKTVLGGTSINFYNEKVYWPYILVFVHIWKGLGYSSIIYLSAIISIDRNLHDAAKIDGCGRMRIIGNITLPLLKPTIFTLVLLQIGRIFYSDFGLFYQVPMNSGALYTVTNTIDTYVYRALMQLNNLSMASAASAFQAIVGFVLVLSVNLIVRYKSKENALF
ncbi:MAG: ABC transporter permease [Saccharofermentanales bacterium]|jgi:ABC-type polysaccharide transport system permease subunit